MAAIASCSAETLTDVVHDATTDETASTSTLKRASTEVVQGPNRTREGSGISRAKTDEIKSEHVVSAVAKQATEDRQSRWMNKCASTRRTSLRDAAGANITQACDKFKTASHVVGKLSAMLGAVETDSEGSPRGFLIKQKAQSKILS